MINFYISQCVDLMYRVLGSNYSFDIADYLLPQEKKKQQREDNYNNRCYLTFKSTMHNETQWISKGRG